MAKAKAMSRTRCACGRPAIRQVTLRRGQETLGVWCRACAALACALWAQRRTPYQGHATSRGLRRS